MIHDSAGGFVSFLSILVPAKIGSSGVRLKAQSEKRIKGPLGSEWAFYFGGYTNK